MDQSDGRVLTREPGASETISRDPLAARTVYQARHPIRTEPRPTACEARSVGAFQSKKIKTLSMVGLDRKSLFTPASNCWLLFIVTRNGRGNVFPKRLRVGRPVSNGANPTYPRLRIVDGVND